MTDQAEAQPQATEEPLEYALVEIMGHRRHFGRIREEERFGVKMLRIDVPQAGDFANGFATHFYSGSSIFSITYTDLATVCAKNKPYESPRLFSATRDDDDGVTGDGRDGSDLDC